MTKDPLQAFVAGRESLLKRQAELAKINSALGMTLVIEEAAAAEKASPARAVKRSGRRAKNGMSLKVAVLAATKSKPLTKAEILMSVGKLGYEFKSKNPLNSLSTFLYTNKAIKNYDGKFGPR